MSDARKKLKNWWWYHRVHVAVSAAVLAVLLYSTLPGLLAPKPDYALAVAALQPLPQETLDAVRQVLLGFADDANGDGRVIVDLHPYTLDLSGRTEGTLNFQGAAAFDADLVGKVSSLILLDDPAGFRANVAVAVEELLPCESLPAFASLLPAGYAFTARSDGNALSLYRAIAESAG